MTEDELAELLTDCPTFYHMAERGTWPSIQQYGLLSTAALLDLYGIQGRERILIERKRRAQSVVLSHPLLPPTVVRDQLPMDDASLHRCLPAHLKPADWYFLLNQKVFFWLTRERLSVVLNAGTYRDRPHDIIEVAARSLVAAYREKIWLCPMNSGCTKPWPHPRNEETFRRIKDYPYAERRRKKKRGERVVELAIDYTVPNVRDFVLRVVEMQADRVNRIIYSR
jgi:hypothetical protein